MASDHIAGSPSIPGSRGNRPVFAIEPICFIIIFRIICSTPSRAFRYTKEVRAAGVTLIVIVSVLVVALLLGIALFTVTVPTTFGCRAFIDASAEARLEYPNARLLSYVSREGSRDLTGMSNRQLPGFTKYWEISSDDQEGFRWFDVQLQALGWKPLDLRGSDQFRQAGSTERGSVAVDGLPRPAEVISLVHMDGSQVDITVSGTSPRAVLRLIYLITTPAEFPACR